MESHLRIFRSILIECIIVLVLLQGLKNGIQDFNLPETFYDIQYLDFIGCVVKEL
jgi:hypothetical protein